MNEKKLTEMIIFKQGFVIKNVQNTRTFNLSNCSNMYLQPEKTGKPETKVRFRKVTFHVGCGSSNN
jgi:hypothetical protein